MQLVIVESPTKAKTISQYLGDEFIVRSSYGHIRDLPKAELGIDVEHDFEPSYIIPTKAKKNLSELKKEAAKADTIILATDEDREGEAIAWHLVEAMGLEKPKTKKPVQRIVFHEITKTAIAKALEEPREITSDLVDAQQARRVLDRLVGYKLSPILWKRYWRGLSAGRVQSVAVRLIVEREREIEAFTPEEYWSIAARLKAAEGPEFTAQLAEAQGKPLEKLSIRDEISAKKIVDDLEGADWAVKAVERKEATRMPYAPFTTSTLQQEASRRLRYSSRQTMMFAQALYEAGHITYMRTDSVNLSEQSLIQATEFISSAYGVKYHKRRKFKTKSKSAQEAHEAVRPTDPTVTSETLTASVSPQQAKLYDLIRCRFLASQMANARFDATTIDVIASDYVFRATGSVITFDGWLKVYPSKVEESELPAVKESEHLDLQELQPEQHFTKPPARYNEASLIKTLEKEGIGRPSTYASIIFTIVKRSYVEKDRSRAFHPTDTGKQVNDFLVQEFPRIVDVKFTSHMEDELDDIANGKRKWVPVIREFYDPFASKLKEKTKKAKEAKEAEVEQTDKICDKCNSPMIVKRGRFGKFIACSNFPKCKNVLKEPKEEQEVEKVGRVCPQDEGELVYRRSRFGKFIACSNFPKCRYTEKIKKETDEEEKELDTKEKKASS